MEGQVPVGQSPYLARMSWTTLKFTIMIAYILIGIVIGSLLTIVGYAVFPKSKSTSLPLRKGIYLKKMHIPRS